MSRTVIGFLVVLLAAPVLAIGLMALRTPIALVAFWFGLFALTWLRQGDNSTLNQVQFSVYFALVYFSGGGGMGGIRKRWRRLLDAGLTAMRAAALQREVKQSV